MSDATESETLDEHDLLTTLPSAQMIEAGAARIKAEREIFRSEGWGEPSDEHLAANAYEAMVFCAIGRGLSLPVEAIESKGSLAAKIRQLRKYGNEIAIGWNDCGCFWTLHHGVRGSGAMIEGIGLVLHSEACDFEEAVDEFLAELLRLHGPRK